MMTDFNSHYLYIGRNVELGEQSTVSPDEELEDEGGNQGDARRG